VAVFTSAGSYTSAASFDSGFAAAMVACGVLSLAGALSGLAAPTGTGTERRRPATTNQAVGS
jgi:hypothetical protein